MKTAREINDDLNYLFSKINLFASALDVKAIDIMNTIFIHINESCMDEGVAFENGFQEGIKKAKETALKKKCGNCHFATNQCTRCEFHTYVDSNTDLFLKRINSEHYCSDWEVKKL